MRRWLAASTPCAAACCSASTRCSWSAAEPCKPFDAGRVGLSLGEAGGFAVLERIDARGPRHAPASCSCAATANPATPTTCRRRTRKASARSTRCAMRSRAAASTPATSATSTCTAPRPRPTTSAEALAVAAMFPDTPARQLHQGLDRAHARRRRHRRIGDRAARARVRRAARHAQQQRRATPSAARRSVSTTRARTTLRYAMNNSFGFGGNNCSLLFGKAA